jgi:protein kinase A
MHLSGPERDKLAGALIEIFFEPDKPVITVGDASSDFYIIRSGEAILSYQQADALVPVVSLTAGDHFGEQAILHNVPSPTAITAVTPLTVWKLPRGSFHTLLSPKHIDVRFATRGPPEGAVLRLRDPVPEHYEFLNKIELCSSLTNAERGEVAAVLEPVSYPPRTDIYLVGDPADALYLVVEGCVILTIESKQDEKEKDAGEADAGDDEASEAVGMRTEITRCTAGTYFGERALIGQLTTKVAATSAGKPCKLLKLGKAQFHLLNPLVEMLKTKLVADETSGLQLVGYDDWEWKKHEVKLEELKELGLLGTGGFGSVTLVQAKDGSSYALKAVSKQQVVQRKQKSHIWNEKTILSRMDHPCIVKLYNSFKDNHYLYFLLEPMLGGELSSILKREKTLEAPQARFYAASVVLAFEYLHAQNLIYRDLKPENLLLDQYGLLKLADFGFCKFVRNRTFTVCGTPSYMAPEIIAHKGYGKGVDWWTVGILLFEMLAGHPPFQAPSGGDRAQLYEEISKGTFRVPAHFDADVKSLIKGLLRTRPHIRFGMNKEGGARATDAIKNHPWFAGFDWQALLWRKLKPPFIPKVDGNADTANFRSREFKKKNFMAYHDDGTGWDQNF